MKFFKKTQNTTDYIDSIFPVVQLAKKDGDPNAINGTAGCLCDEEGKLFTYKTVFESEKKLESIRKASYASSPSGNEDYLNAITKYILEDRVNNNHCTIATVGGTGSIYASVQLCLDDNDYILYPDIAWGNYKVIAQENNLQPLTYDVYNLDDLFNKIDMCNDKAFIIINSPCENPLGHSYSKDEWHKMFEKFNSSNKEIIILIDNAYMDYAYDDPKSFFDEFNTMNDNVLVLIGVSCSKSFSYYGVRLGALIAINNDEQFIKKFDNMASRLARTTWSNVSNGAMLTITDILNNNYDEYIKERDESVLMLKKRTDLFIKQAKEVGLETYPYNSGFFITLKAEDLNIRDKWHQNLIDSHIYTVKVNKGLRLGICSIPLSKIDGLAKKINDMK